MPWWYFTNVLSSYYVSSWPTFFNLKVGEDVIIVESKHQRKNCKVHFSYIDKHNLKPFTEFNWSLHSSSLYSNI